MINRLSLRAKLVLPVAVVFLTLLGVAGLAVHTQQIAQQELLHQQHVQTQTVGLAMQFRLNVEHAVSGVYQSLTWEAVSFDAAQIKAHDQTLLTTLAALAQPLVARLREPGLDEKERKLLESIRTRIGSFVSGAKDTIDLKSSAQGLALASLSLATAESALADLKRDVQSFDQMSRQRAESEVQAAQQRLRTASIITAVLVTLALTLGALLASLGLRSVLVSVRQLQTAFGLLSAGDLRQPLLTDKKDEIGELVVAAEELRLRLNEIMAQVAWTSTEVTTAAGEIASGTLDLSQRTERQASALKSAASSMDHMSAQVAENASAAKQASMLASSATDVASQGQQAMARMIETMSTITAQSRQIADIIGVIDGIAFQTNILALNAAVEAARAGEQGRGFAVVAAEVRSLAQRCAGAAKEIKTLISNSVTQVETGSALVGDVGSTITRVVDEVRRVNQTIQSISQATSHQSTGISEVSNAVAHIDTMTQQNAALVEQSSAAAESLREQSARLTAALEVFRLAH